MTLEQKKEVTDALVAFVLTVTNKSHFIDRSEAMALPAALDFLMSTDLSESIYNLIPETMIGSTVIPDLYKMAKKFAESYEAFVSAYTNALLMCLQGLVSPATLGIDVGKMSSAEAQREKKDVTGNTRNTITTALEKALPELIEAILKTYDNMQRKAPGNYNTSVSFGEYGAPDFDSRVETVGKADTYGIMSVKTQVDELWGSSKDDKWKADEVQRIKSEKGLLEADDPSVGGKP